MCERCGCSDSEHDHAPKAHASSHPRDHAYAELHAHTHDPEPAHAHAPTSTQSRRIRLESDILGRDTLVANENRSWFRERGILALNFVSSPGAGKTSLLERTLRYVRRRFPIYVIQGDQATERDADRVRRAGAIAVQLNTGTVCHLDARVVGEAARALNPPRGSLLAIENIGNLVCPALFDLGEQARVVVASLPEGSDKPLKYPYMFRSADLVILNKSDLLPYLDFEIREFVQYVRIVNPNAEIMPLSVTRGNGLEAWYCWLESRLPLSATPLGAVSVSHVRHFR